MADSSTVLAPTARAALLACACAFAPPAPARPASRAAPAAPTGGRPPRRRRPNARSRSSTLATRWPQSSPPPGSTAPRPWQRIAALAPGFPATAGCARGRIGYASPAQDAAPWPRIEPEPGRRRLPSSAASGDELDRRGRCRQPPAPPGRWSIRDPRRPCSGPAVRRHARAPRARPDPHPRPSGRLPARPPARRPVRGPVRAAARPGWRLARATATRAACRARPPGAPRRSARHETAGWRRTGIDAKGRAATPRLPAHAARRRAHHLGLRHAPPPGAGLHPHAPGRGLRRAHRHARSMPPADGTSPRRHARAATAASSRIAPPRRRRDARTRTSSASRRGSRRASGCGKADASAASGRPACPPARTCHYEIAWAGAVNPASIRTSGLAAAGGAGTGGLPKHAAAGAGVASRIQPTQELAMASRARRPR